MSKMSWRDVSMEWGELLFFLFFLFIILVGFESLFSLAAGESDLSGTVENVVAVHGDFPHSIVTIDGEEYRYDGDVAPEEGDEIVFSEERGLGLTIPRMDSWHHAD